MDEKLNELLETVQQTAVNAVYVVGRQTEALIASARLRARLAALEAEVDERLKEAGRMVYATHTGVPTPSVVLLEKLREIDGLEAQITALRRESGCWRCTACGGENRSGDIFCRSCGRRL